MEFVVLMLFAAVAAAAIGLGRGRELELATDLEGLSARRGVLLAELRDLDEDANLRRITPEDRAEGRRALAPELRAVTEELRRLGEEAPRAAAPRQDGS